MHSSSTKGTGTGQLDEHCHGAVGRVQGFSGNCALTNEKKTAQPVNLSKNPNSYENKRQISSLSLVIVPFTIEGKYG